MTFDEKKRPLNEVDQPTAVSSNSAIETPPERRGGPRTAVGKQRSSKNAIKHGIFSTATTLKGECHSQYRSLLKGLLEYFQPVGKAEEVLVEKLADLLRRQRRLLRAETAEIRKNTDFIHWDRTQKENDEAQQVARGPEFSFDLLKGEIGLIKSSHNPNVLDRCIELLTELHQEIGTSGFHNDHDMEILRKIYGTYGHLRETLYDSYPLWFETAKASEEERKREGYVTSQQCIENILHEIAAEIRKLKRERKTQARIDSERIEVEVLRHEIPDAAGLDRLLRYEANLDRSFDRTLNQLERLQRMRRDQPVEAGTQLRNGLPSLGACEA